LALGTSLGNRHEETQHLALSVSRYGPQGKAKTRKSHLDSAAAAIILQEYLDAREGREGEKGREGE
jgi:RNase H-fold protein (predicted Holliday junction resolvase)